MLGKTSKFCCNIHGLMLSLTSCDHHMLKIWLIVRVLPTCTIYVCLAHSLAMLTIAYIYTGTYLFYECCHTCYSVGLVLREFKFSLRLCNNFQSRLNFLNYPFRDEISVWFLLDRRNIMKALRVDNTLCKIYCTQFLSKLSNLELCTQCIMHRTIIVCSIGQWGTSLFYLDFSVTMNSWSSGHPY